MFAVIYTFEIHTEMAQEFIQSWGELTELIKKYEGGLGSRLHKQEEGKYLAYAQWPDRDTWKNSGDKLPAEADDVWKRMKACCISSETTFTMDLEKDLLIPYE